MARRRLEGLERVLGANALFSTAYGRRDAGERDGATLGATVIRLRR